MCLGTTQTKAKIAKEDIYTFKVMWIVDGIIRSPYQRTIYKLGEDRNRVKFGFGYNRTQIEEGYHSLIFRPEKTKWFDKLDKSLFLCKIPKGSKYYVGNRGDVVSNQIVMIEQIYSPHDSYNKEYFKSKTIQYRPPNVTTLMKYLHKMVISHGLNIDV